MRTMSAGATPRTGTLNSIRSHRATSAPGRSSTAGRGPAAPVAPAAVGTAGPTVPGVLSAAEQDQEQRKRRSATLENETRRMKNSSSSGAVHSTHRPPTHSKSLQQIAAVSAVNDVIKPCLNGSIVHPEATAAGEQRQQQRQSFSCALPSNHKTTVDDFNCIYDDNFERRDQSLDRLEQIEANNVEQRRRLRDDDDDVVRQDSSKVRGVRRSDNLSQDSYRVTDSRDSSLDRLDRDDDYSEDVADRMRRSRGPPTPPLAQPACSDVVDRGLSAPLDEVRLLRQLERERQLQEDREKRSADISNQVLKISLILFCTNVSRRIKMNI